MRNRQSKKASAHDSSSFTDVESVSLIQNILASHKRVMPRIFSQDKWPNIDGHVEIQNEEGCIVGRLFVQAKTLNGNPITRFKCPIQFFSNCEIDPCLLFGVDNKNKKIYWLYFDANEVKKIDFKNHRHSKTINFDPHKYFDSGETKYIAEWQRIVESNRQKFQNYDQLKNAYEIISQHSNVAIGQKNRNFVGIHKFLDSLNDLAWNKLPIVKSRYYPNAWSLGLAYYSYEPNSVSYTLFPISFDSNDVQIKQVDQQLLNRIQKQGLGFKGHFAENPIEMRPEEYAKEIAGSKALKLIESQLLDHSKCNFLAEEFVFSFIEKFHEQMGLDIKSSYEIGEVKKAFFSYLPLWLHRSHALLKSEDRNNFNERIKKGRITFFDPDRICEMKDGERKTVSSGVELDLKNKKEIPNIPMGNDKMPFGLFVEFFEQIKDKKKITRVTKAKDFSRLGKKGGWVWSVYSKKDAELNFRIILDYVLDVYNQIIEQNFAGLKQELSFGRGANTILATVKVKEDYNGFESGPTYKLYFLNKKDGGTSPRSIEIIDESAARKLDSALAKNFSFNGEEYEFVSAWSSILDFLYEDCPMLQFVYKILERRFEEYMKGNNQ